MRATIVLIALILLWGCTSVGWEAMPQPIVEALAERKAQGMHGRDPALMDGEPVESLLGSGTPIIVSSSANLAVELRRDPSAPEFVGSEGEDWALYINWKMGAGQTFGTAAAVAADGYFLTAAHVVDEGPKELITAIATASGDPELQRSSARVVWAPADSADELDFAVVHAQVGPVDAFRLHEGKPVVDEAIVTGGWPIKYLGSHPGAPRVSGGRITEANVRDASGDLPAFTILRHDAPVLPGESGGPVLDHEGRLIGVNSKVYFSFDLSFWQKLLMMVFRRFPEQAKLESIAVTTVMPTPVWLRHIIENDRQRIQGATSAVRAYQGPTPLRQDSQ